MISRQTAIDYVSNLRDAQESEHQGDQHTIPEWIIITRRQLQKAEDAWYAGQLGEATRRMGHVAACGIAALEQNAVSNHQ